MKIALVIVVVVVGLSVILEVLLRSLVGFGNPLIYITDPEIGYLLAPSQQTRRFGNRIAINEYSMRSPTITVNRPESTLRILILGDSVANGAWWTDQQQTISALLATQLEALIRGSSKESLSHKTFFERVEVLNASANSWGPRNELAYLKRFGTFEAQVVVLLLNTDDLFAMIPSSAAVGRDRNYPAHKPPLALVEVFSRYVLPLILPERESRINQVPPEKDPVGSNLEAIGQIQTVSNNNTADFVLAMTPLLREIGELGPREYELEARARLSEFTKNRQITYLDFLPVFQQTETPEVWYRDHIHLSSQGNKRVSEVISSLPVLRNQLSVATSP
ncbi:MAG: SGNH/GDSL hydrolase family protein [Symploca sp. SIO1A3]|nr:SGNH/GDSL hydrolase family protein [Symploca sp. SIO2C1]NER49095.1 SGNH/GDSL hydrolase family protein [Symploca sp. SIO1A3]